MLIVINGSSGSGKDEFVSQAIKNSSYKIYNFSTIDYIKNIMLDMGWNGEKTPETRKIMAELKQIWIKINPNNCTNYVELRYNRNKGYSYDFQFIHCREPDEIDKIVKRIPNTKTLLIKSEMGKAFKNGADDIVDNYNYDYVIENNGTIEELKDKAIMFLNNIKGVN